MATRFQIQDRRSDQPAWVDDFPDSALAQLLGALPEANVYALIDNAFDTGFAQRLRSRFPGLHPQSLYAGRYDGPGLAEIAPSVIHIPDGETERRAFLEFALNETSGKPMLSFLHPSAAALDPVAHLKDQMEAVDHEGKAFLVRFADTRSLDALQQVWDDAQCERFLNGFPSANAARSRRKSSLGAASAARLISCGWGGCGCTPSAAGQLVDSRRPTLGLNLVAAACIRPHQRTPGRAMV